MAQEPQEAARSRKKPQEADGIYGTAGTGAGTSFMPSQTGSS